MRTDMEYKKIRNRADCNSTSDAETCDKPSVATKFVIVILLLTLILLILCAGLTYIQDPFFHYRDPFKNRSFEDAPYYLIDNATYQIPGLVKNRDYDAIISGSSLTQNFDPEFFNSLFGFKTLKASLSGANAKNSSTIVGLALHSHPELRQAFILLDLPNYYYDTTSEGNQPPVFLSNDSFFDDVSYLLNKEVLLNYTLYNAWIRYNNLLHNAPENEQGMWYGFSYGIKKVLSQYNRPEACIDDLPIEPYIMLTQQSVTNYWLPLIMEHPNTTFTFFVPPFSILYWDEAIRLGAMPAYLEGYRTVIKDLLNYKNVEVYFFADAKEVITDLWNYKDTWHYHYHVNDWMTQCMASGLNRVNLEVLDSTISSFKQWLSTYDVDWVFNKSFIEITDSVDYLAFLINSGYSMIATIDLENECLLPDEFKSLFKDCDNKVQENGWLFIIRHDDGLISTGVISKENPVVQSTLDNRVIALNQIDVDGTILFSISIDGVEYSQNSRGLSIITYDMVNHRVVDSVAFEGDTLNVIQRDGVWSDLPYYRNALRQICY